jgi:hypothetical protein
VRSFARAASRGRAAERAFCRKHPGCLCAHAARARKHFFTIPPPRCAAALAQRMREHFAGTRTTFLGELRGRELAQAYASADAFVMPSETETLGNVVGEVRRAGRVRGRVVVCKCVRLLSDCANSAVCVCVCVCACVYQSRAPPELLRELTLTSTSPRRKPAPPPRTPPLLASFP